MGDTISSDIQNALERVWPGNAGPEAAVKRAAAEFVLNHPGRPFVKSVHVSSHVSATVGKVSALGITKKFEQLLREDPCFTFDRRPNKALTDLENVVAVDTVQLLSQSSWRRDEQPTQDQQWQQHQQPQQQQQVGSPPGLSSSSSSTAAVAGSSSGGRPFLKATPRLLQGLNELWPLSGPTATPDSKLKHTALVHLLRTPNHTAEYTELFGAINAALGCNSYQELGCTLPMPDLLSTEPSIFVPGQGPSDGFSSTVGLNVQGVLGKFVRRQHAAQASPYQQEQQPQQQPLSPQQQQQQWVQVQGQTTSAAPEEQHAGDAVQAGAPGSGPVVSAASLLLHVRSMQWHGSDPVLDAVRRALAERLVLKVNAAAAKDGQQPARSEAKWYTMLGSLAGYTIAQALEGLGQAAGRSPPSLEDCVDQDRYLSIYFVGEVQHIKLDIEQLLQDVAATSAAAAMLKQERQQQQQQQRAAAAGAGSSATARNAAAASAGAGSSMQAAGWKAASGASSSRAQAGAAAGQFQQVSAAALLQHVSSRAWHSSNLQLHLARQTLARHLVAKANDGAAAHCPANADVEVYRENFARSGILINQALKKSFGGSAPPCYKKFADVFADDPCWQVIPSSMPGGQLCVQLNLPLLLQEAAALQDPYGGLHSNSSSSHGPGMQAAASSAAATTATAKPGGAAAASSSGGSRPAAVRAPAVAPTPAAAAAAAGAAGAGDAGAAEAAMAAIKAAARSLMPPAVKHSAASAATASPLAGSAAGAEFLGSSASTPGAAAEASTGTAAAGATASAAAPQNPFLPIWLRGIGGSAAGATQQQQQQEPQPTADEQSSAELLPSTAAAVADEGALQQAPLSVTASGPSGPWVASATTPTEQQGGTASMPAVAIDAPSSSNSGQEQPEEVPLHYELVLSNSVPGWYTASYLPYDSAAGAGAAGTCSNAHGAAGSSDGNSAGSPDAADGALAISGGNPAALPVSSGPAAAAAGNSTDSWEADVAAPGNAAGHAPGTAQKAAECVNGRLAAAAAASGGDGEGLKEAAQQQQCDEDLLVLLEAVPDRLRLELQPYLTAAGSDKPQVTHIILDIGRPVTLRLSNRTSVQLESDVTLGDTLRHLLAVQQQRAMTGSASAAASAHQSNGTSDGSTNVAAAAAPSEAGAAAAAAVAAGQFEGDCQAAACQLFGPGLGSCLGIPGSCHRVCAVLDAAGRVAGLTYCLARCAPGAAGGLADVLSGMKASLSVEAGLDRPRSLLVLGRPGAGKTRLLRDICRLMSASPAQGGLGLHVMLLDTTGAVAGLHSQPTPHIGAARVVPVPDRAQQAHTMARIARSHQPDVLIVGELATQQEAAAAVHITRSCNVLLVAAAPASSLRMLLQDSTLCHLVGCEKLGPADMQRALPCPFSIAVELLGQNRCCLDTDLQASSDDLMLQLGSSSKQGSQSQPAKKLDAAPDAHAQIRSRDTSGRLVVQFGSAAAAGAALADAAIVDIIARDSAAYV